MPPISFAPIAQLSPKNTIQSITKCQHKFNDISNQISLGSTNSEFFSHIHSKRPLYHQSRNQRRSRQKHRYFFSHLVTCQRCIIGGPFHRLPQHQCFQLAVCHTYCFQQSVIMNIGCHCDQKNIVDDQISGPDHHGQYHKNDDYRRKIQRAPRIRPVNAIVDLVAEFTPIYLS